jgi:siroheme synthase-like protein
MLPLILDLNGKKIVVFGGGEVGFRKASFFEKEADVVVVSRTFCEKFNGSTLRTIREDAEKVLEGMIETADMVVAATDSQELNEKILEECFARGVWCNCATTAGDMIIPSLVRRDGYFVAISTLGRSPAMSKYLKHILEERLAPEYSAMVALQERLRAVLKEAIADQGERERVLWDVLKDEQVWELLRAGDETGAMSLAERRTVRVD